MPVFWWRKREFTPSGSGDLEELKLDILARSLPEPGFKVPEKKGIVVPVTASTVVDRMSQACDYLAANQWDPQVLASYFKTPLVMPDVEVKEFDPSRERRLDIPASFRLKKLYRNVDCQATVNTPGIYTACFGCLRGPDDPKSGRLRVYCNHADRPQVKAPKQSNVVFDDDISCWIKYSVNFNEKGKPVLNINPIQMASIHPDDREIVISELEHMRISADPGKRRQIDWKLNVMTRKSEDTNVEDDLADAEIKHKSPFTHRDRGYPLALLGLLMAEVLGVKDIGVRNGALNPTNQALHDLYLREIDHNVSISPTIDRRYVEFVYFLKKGRHGFNINDIHNYPGPIR